MSQSSVKLAKLAIAYEKAFAVFFPAFATEMAELASAHLIEEGVTYLISFDGGGITCVRCRHASSNRYDVSECYCGFCHVFLGTAGS